MFEWGHHWGLTHTRWGSRRANQSGLKKIELGATGLPLKTGTNAANNLIKYLILLDTIPSPRERHS